MDNGVARSFLYAPAHRARLLDRALQGTTAADAVIVDLEDGVPADGRADAERNLRSCVRPPQSDLTVLCRIRSGAHRGADLALVPSWFDGVLLAKAEDADDVRRVAEATRTPGRTLGLWLLVESARGVENLPALLGAGPTVAGVMLGAGDLRADLGLVDDTDDRQLDAARSRVVFSAVAAGVAHVVDTPEADIEPGERFLAAARSARGLGLTGKAAIHPAQLAAIHDVFRPTGSQRVWARDVLDAPDGAVRLDGSMVDGATKRLARRILGDRLENREDRQ